MDLYLLKSKTFDLVEARSPKSSENHDFVVHFSVFSIILIQTIHLKKPLDRANTRDFLALSLKNSFVVDAVRKPESFFKTEKISAYLLVLYHLVFSIS